MTLIDATKHLDEVKSYLQVQEAAQRTLQDALLRSEAELASIKAELTSVCEELKVIKAGQKAPKRSIVVGASIADPRLGPLPMWRSYDQLLRRPSPTQRVAHSYKVGGGEREWLSAACAGSSLARIHEPENDIEKGTLTAAQWVKANLEMLQAFRDVKRPDLTPTITFMGYSLSKMSGRAKMLQELLHPEVVAGLKELKGVLSWDVYAGEKGKRSPANMFAIPAAFANDLGLRWAVSETGIRQDAETDGAALALQWQEIFDYLKALPSPPVWFLAWNRKPLDPTAEFSFAVQEIPEVAAVWKREMARSA